MPIIDADECANMGTQEVSGVIRQFEGGVGDFRKNGTDSRRTEEVRVQFGSWRSSDPRCSAEIPPVIDPIGREVDGSGRN